MIRLGGLVALVLLQDVEYIRFRLGHVSAGLVGGYGKRVASCGEGGGAVEHILGPVLEQHHALPVLPVHVRQLLGLAGHFKNVISL